MEEVKRSLDLFQYTYRNRHKIYLIIQNIKKELIELLGNLGIYIAISDVQGNIKYIDSEMEDFYKYIQDYCKSNIKEMEPGSFSIPLKNLIFFKISEKVIVIFSTKNSKVSCLVTFISKMDKYQAVLNHLIDKINTINYWNTKNSSVVLFNSIQDRVNTFELDDLLKLAEQFLNEYQFENCLNILKSIKSISEKLGDKSQFGPFVDQIIKNVEKKLNAKKDVN